MSLRARLALLVTVVLALGAAPTAHAATSLTSVPGFDGPCPAYASDSSAPTSNPGPRDTRICSGQVPSFDGTYLDVDLTLPTNGGAGPHPLMIMLNGFGNDKHYWESSTDEGDGEDLYHWNNKWFAEHGYYVLTYTPRGFRGKQPNRTDFRPDTPRGDSSRTGGPTPAGPPSPKNATDGTIRLKSREYEIRDTEFLAALVAAGYNVDPQQLAATGDSYGGGESWLLASQGHFPFPEGVDPNGKKGPLEFQVTVPKYGWTDLAYSLAPNGHPGPFPSSSGGCDENSDDDPCYASSQQGPERPDGAPCFGVPPTSPARPDPLTGCNPIGVPKDSFLKGLYVVGQLNGDYEQGTGATPSEEGPVNVTAWNARVQAGDPFDAAGVETPIIQQIRRGLTEFRSSYYQDKQWQAQCGPDYDATGVCDPRARKTAVFSIQGWTDDLFEAVESFRQFKYLKHLDPRWPVEVALADVGHQRGRNPHDDWQRLNDQAFQFLQANINGSHDQQTTVSSQPTVCPNDPDGSGHLKQAQELTATTPEGLSNGRLTVTLPDGSTNTATAGLDPDNQNADPVFSAQADPGACRVSTQPTFPGRYTAVSPPLHQETTYIGLGVVKVPYVLAGSNTATLNARIWDVGPGGALLMTRGTYRIDAPAYDGSSGQLSLPLFGNHWRLRAGHSIRVDLTQVDQFGGPAPAAAGLGMFQKSNEQSTIAIGGPGGPPRLILPTRESGDRTIDAR